MKLARGVLSGAWFLIGLNLLMGLGAIWIFVRMSPAIERIIEQNERSLHACEDMLSSLALAVDPDADGEALRMEFQGALARARNNITEVGEPLAVEAIARHFEQAFSGEAEARASTVSAIRELSGINRAAMVKADHNARQFGTAGAWGIVFMASAIYVVGLVFVSGLRRRLVKPLAEMHSVVLAIRAGDRMRRCSGSDLPPDIRVLFEGFNDILDQNGIAFAERNDVGRVNNVEEI